MGAGFSTMDDDLITMLIIILISSFFLMAVGFGFYIIIEAYETFEEIDTL